MTLRELQREALELQAEERAVLVGTLIQSLDPSQRKTVRDHLDEDQRREMDELGDRLEAQMESWFTEGEGREWTQDDWARLKKGEYRHAPDPESLAVPPGWRSPRLDHQD
jgi:hypothetical protein